MISIPKEEKEKEKKRIAKKKKKLQNSEDSTLPKGLAVVSLVRPTLELCFGSSFFRPLAAEPCFTFCQSLLHNHTRITPQKPRHKLAASTPSVSKAFQYSICKGMRMEPHMYIYFSS